MQSASLQLKLDRFRVLWKRTISAMFDISGALVSTKGGQQYIEASRSAMRLHWPRAADLMRQVIYHSLVHAIL
jgi:hypothetical protein